MSSPDATVAPIIFLDTETTGLARDDEIWEFAAIRRDPDGTQTELHLFIEHDETKCARLPEEFRADHANRFPAACSGRVTSRRDACHGIRRFIDPIGTSRPVMVGINPGFDLDRISALIRAEFPHWDPTPWHYTPVDARHLAVGALAAQPPLLVGFDGSRSGQPHLAAWPSPPPLAGPPWGSEDVSRMVDIDPDAYARHTAMGDVQWAMAIYDAVTGGPRNV